MNFVFFLLANLTCVSLLPFIDMNFIDAEQLRTKGQDSHSGFLAVHTIAPRSIKDWFHSGVFSLDGKYFFAVSHASLSVSNKAPRSTLPSTRFILISTTGN